MVNVGDMIAGLFNKNYYSLLKLVFLTNSSLRNDDLISYTFLWVI